jgi:SAM-dependent methyltransferase
MQLSKATSSLYNVHSLFRSFTDFSRCRICGSERIVKRGEVEFYFGYAWPIYDCSNCGCRFTPHEESIYDLLNSEPSSRYGVYIDQATSCKVHFDRGNLDELRAELSQTSKYGYIIDKIEREHRNAKILEIGCSRGHLTSFFILDGRKIKAVDVSQTAVAAALGNFGAHFVLAGDPSIDAQAPYDIIFHVGTIGCVADPIGMTTRLLNLLKPGGQLLFNAPNRDGFTLRDQLWFESAPPPDVVTLFPRGFWRERFAATAQTDETVEFNAPQQNLFILLRRLAGRKWRKPVPIPLRESGCLVTSAPRIWHVLLRNFAQAVGRVAAWTGLDRFAPRYPTEYGLFVQMIKR